MMDTTTKVLSGAEIICECLHREGVKTVFGYPGGAILPTYDALARDPRIHHVLTRHEQGASHMADGFARASGDVGVAIATSGPGATNLVTGIATANMDSSPLVCITGQVVTSALGSDAFQEADIFGITLPITKHSEQVTDVADLASTIHRAFAIAREGRPGPVLVDVPKDVQIASTSYSPPPFPATSVKCRQAVVDDADVARAVELLQASERPLILAGNGVLISGAERILAEFVEQSQIPVALTLLGKGALSELHPLCLGMMGMHGEAFVNKAIQQADLLIALGMRFDDRVTGELALFAPDARKIHVDIDPSEIGKNVPVDVGLVGDLKAVLTRLLPGIEPTDSAWPTLIQSWRADSDARDILHQDSAGRLWAAHVMHDLWDFTDGEALTVTDVGQHQMWEAQYYRHHRSRTLLTSGGLGTMGFAVPAAIGAKFARPEEEVWAIVGDGGFQMTMAELGTAVQEQIPIKIALINNGHLGMVRQWQELFYEERYYATPLANPNFCKLAEAFGLPAVAVRNRAEIEPAVQWARAVEQGPCLIEFVVEQREVVYPVVPPGAGLDAMIRRPVNAPTTLAPRGE